MLFFLIPLSLAEESAGTVIQELRYGSMDWTNYVLTVKAEASTRTGSGQDTRVVEQAARNVLEPRIVAAASSLCVLGPITAGQLMEEKDLWSRQEQADSGSLLASLALKLQQLLPKDESTMVGDDGGMARSMVRDLSRWHVVEAHYYSSGRVTLEAELQVHDWLSPLLNYQGRESVGTMETSRYSGLVIDARELDLTLSVAPILEDISGEVLYSAESISAEVAIEYSPVVWVNSPSAVEAIRRAGSNPYFARADRVKQDSKLVLSADDMVAVRQIMHNSNIMEQAKVVIVVSQ